MSYLKMEKADLPNMKSGIISIWVKVPKRVETVPESKWDKTWLPPHLDESMDRNDAAWATSSYWPSPTAQFGCSHIFTYPPGGSAFGGGDLVTFKDKFVPFLCFGDPKQQYDRCKWKKKTIGPPVWVLGKGGVPQNLVAQNPKEGGDWVPEGGTPPPASTTGDVTKEDNIIPPSAFGIHNNRTLRIILQTKNKAKYTGYAWAQVKSETIHIQTPVSCQDVLHNPHPCSEPEGWVDFSEKQSIFPNQFVGFNLRYEDVSMLECGAHPEAFIMDTDVEIADGKWHHILLCFDLGDGPEDGTDPATGYGAEAASPPSSPAAAPTDGAETPPAVPPQPGSRAVIHAEATGPDGDRPALAGTWGQFSGVNGEYALAPFGCLSGLCLFGIGCTYEELACYGRPFEEVGKFSYANNGKISSKAKAWLYVDDKPITGKELNHRQAWKTLEGRSVKGNTGKALLDALDKHAILPPNAFLAPFEEIRTEMSTNKTGWERDYRTLLGGFNGPAARIDPTDEMRQLDHPRPKYEFSPGALPTKGHPVCIPAGDSFGIKDDKVVANFDIILAELQIWANEKLDFDLEENRRLFIGPKLGPDGKPGDDPSLLPVAMRLPAEKLNTPPHIRLHGSGNWKNGYNTGTIGVRISGDGVDQTKTKIDAGQFVPTGGIERKRPNPKIEIAKAPDAPAAPAKPALAVRAA